MSLEAHSSLAAHDRITLIDDGRLLFPPRKGSALEPVCGMLWRCSTDDLYPAHSLALIQPIHSGTSLCAPSADFHALLHYCMPSLTPTTSGSLRPLSSQPVVHEVATTARYATLAALGLTTLLCHGPQDSPAAATLRIPKQHRPDIIFLGYQGPATSTPPIQRHRRRKVELPICLESVSNVSRPRNLRHTTQVGHSVDSRWTLGNPHHSHSEVITTSAVSITSARQSIASLLMPKEHTLSQAHPCGTSRGKSNLRRLS